MINTLKLGMNSLEKKPKNNPLIKLIIVQYIYKLKQRKNVTTQDITIELAHRIPAQTVPTLMWKTQVD
jgi:hypothetical protein